MSRLAVCCLGLGIAVALCSGCSNIPSSSTSGTSTAPPTAPSPPAPATFSVTGRVTDQQTGGGIAAAVIVVGDGADANKAAVTDSGGSYTLTGLQAGTITLNVTASGYASASQRVAVQANTTQSFVLQSAKRMITGTVIDATSHGILPNILIVVFDGPSKGQSTRTDAQGRFMLTEVSSQSTTLEVSATSYITARAGVPTGGDVQTTIILQRTTGPSPGPVPLPPPTNPTPPANGTAITFDGASGTLTSYTESGYTVTPVMQSWFFAAYGRPGPSLQFTGPSNALVDGEVRITAGGARFQFQSVDVYSSVTTIPYVFTGLLGSTTVYSVSGRQGNTFGSFATVASGQSATAIDTLLIRLTNSSNLNPMGIDNLIVTR